MSSRDVEIVPMHIVEVSLWYYSPDQGDTKAILLRATPESRLDSISLLHPFQPFSGHIRLLSGAYS